MKVSQLSTYSDFFIFFFPQFPFVFSQNVEKPIQSYIKYLFVIMDALS